MVDRGSLRFVDAHVHHWDPGNLEWYPHLAPDFDVSALGVAGADAMKRRYLRDEYLADASQWNLGKYVHVNATSGPKAYLEEARWLAELERPLAGVMGTVDLDKDPGVVLDELTAQAASSLFRGIRNMHVPDLEGQVFAQTLAFLEGRGLVYDLVVHPDTMKPAAKVLAGFPNLTVVVEHTGWPTSTDARERALWRDGLRELARLRSSVVCKLSGIAMATHAVNVATVRPWFDEAIDIFGADRCMVGSNFPVDGVFASFGQVMETYLEVVDAHGAGAVEAIFATTTERVYRI
jgi:predicted TIM-barrel fold metal-dependent hydrolase